MIDRPTVTIIIPVRDEASTIVRTLQTIRNNVKSKHKILVADDGVRTDDQSITVVKEFTKEWSNIEIVLKDKGEEDGFGPALVRAVKRVDTTAVVFMMADLADDPQLIDKMWEVMEKQIADVVVGCRYMRGANKTGGPWLQGLLSALVNRTLPYVSNIKTRDATNAFKMWRTKFIKKIIPAKAERSLAFSLQLSVLAVRHKITVVDIATHWTGRSTGKSKFKIWHSGWPYIKWYLQAVIDKFFNLV